MLDKLDKLFWVTAYVVADFVHAVKKRMVTAAELHRFVRDPSKTQTCAVCKKAFRLEDGCFMDHLDKNGGLVFQCEFCTPNIAPRD